MIDGVEVGATKRTVLGLYMTAKQAYEVWKAKPDRVVIIDVRTPAELLAVGHPPMAWKIPVATQSSEWDPDLGHFRMKLLPDFVSRVRRVASPDHTLLVMCRSGGRSALAANLLARAGFTNVYNIIDGMEGDAVGNPDCRLPGQQLDNGWKNSGSPWTCDLTPHRMLFSGAR